MDSKFYVYSLIDPINRLPFYIGKGCGKRAMMHLKGKDKHNLTKNRYIANIRSLGFEPTLKFFKKGLNESEAFNIETNLIKYVAMRYQYLTNRVGVPKNAYYENEPNYRGLNAVAPVTRRQRHYVALSESQKQKIALTLKGRTLSAEHRASIVKCRTGTGFSIEREVLVELRKTQTTKQIAAQFGVSVQPIKRLIKQFCLQNQEECKQRRLNNFGHA
jgi:hypothetical protein